MGKGKHKDKKGGGNGGVQAAPVTDDPRFVSMHSAPVCGWVELSVDRLV